MRLVLLIMRINCADDNENNLVLIIGIHDILMTRRTCPVEDDKTCSDGDEEHL